MQNSVILSPKEQLSLFGYERYFNDFSKLYHDQQLPNSILLNGPKGSGKSTFAYHFVNYLLSLNEDNKYSLKNFTINPDNKSYKLLCENTHSNFFLLEGNSVDENVKIEKVRNLLQFLNKTTYLSNLKIVLIDNAETLNLNSSNALLKAIEEPQKNTFFLIIYNSYAKILSTLRSRCIDFRVFFNTKQKKDIFSNIILNYKNNYNQKYIDEIFYFDTPGNFLKYLLILDESKINISEDKLSCILCLIERFKAKKDPELFTFISLFVELFYSDLIKKNKINSINLFENKNKILNHLNTMQKFNLDKKNLFVLIENILLRDAK